MVEKMKNKKIVFGRWSAAALLINAMSSRILLNFPRSAIEISGSGALIQTIFIAILVFLLFFIISKLYSNFEGKDLLDIGQQLGGGIVRVLVGAIILAALIYACPVLLREYAENMKIVALTSSPINYVMAFFLAGMITSSYAGIEAIVRFHAAVIPAVIVAYIFILVGVLPIFDSANFYPILGSGIDKIFLGGLSTLTLYTPILYLFLITPFLKKHKNFKIAGYVGLGISAFFFIGSAAIYLGVYPYPTAAEFFLPAYQIARLINYGRFFQRVEAVLFIIWALTALMYLSVILYFLTYVFQKTFSLEYRKPLIIPFAAIIFALSTLPSNLMEVIELGSKYYVYPGIGVAFVLTIILLITANIKKGFQKEGKRGNG